MEEVHNLIVPTEIPFVLTKELVGPFEDVADYSEGLEIVDKLWEYMTILGDKALGLAAPQVGIPKRVAVIRNPLLGNRVHIVNPHDIKGAEPVFISNERCLSLPEEDYPVPRYSTFSFTVLSESNKTELIYGSMASDNPKDTIFCQALQHEVDHLDGRTIKDYCQESKDPYIVNLMTLAVSTQQKLYSMLRTPYRRASPKIGRNEPCPCGSQDQNGRRKKYKKCCMR